MYYNGLRKVLLGSSIETHIFFFLPDSLVLSSGGRTSTWRHNRNVVKHAFSSTTVNRMHSKIWKVANDFSDAVLKACVKGSYQCEGFELFKSVTAEIFGSLALGHNFDSVKSLTVPSLVSRFDYIMQDSELRCQPRNLLNPLYQLYWLPTKKNAMRQDHTSNMRNQLNDICKSKAKLLEEDPTGGDDFLSNLLKSRIASNPKLNQADFDEIIEVLLTILLAGYDTVSIALSYTMWFLAARPQMQAECAKEARHASAVSPTLEEDPLQWASRLAYCRAVVFEAMRLNPPVYMTSRDKKMLALTKSQVKDDLKILNFLLHHPEFHFSDYNNLNGVVIKVVVEATPAVEETTTSGQKTCSI
jgi:cytochrome P450